MVLQRAVLKAQGGVSPDMGALLAEKMNQYASLLASQGSLQTAMSYLPTNTQQVNIRSCAFTQEKDYHVKDCYCFC